MKSIIRTYSSGVHFGEVMEYNPQYGTIKLKDSRRLWFWRVKDSKGISLSEVALYGLDGSSKVCSELPEITISEVIEIIPCSEDSCRSIQGQKVYLP